jgi:Flp pilus assembly secretin CpaC
MIVPHTRSELAATTQLVRALLISCIATISYAGTVTTVSETVYLGESKVLSPLGGIAAAPTQSDPACCRAEQLSATYLVLTGVSLGTSTVTVISDDGSLNAIVYNVTIERNPATLQQLQMAIASQFPGSRVTITAIPSSEKVILRGTVSNRKMAQSIIALVISKTLKRTDLISELKVRCCSCYCR